MNNILGGAAVQNRQFCELISCCCFGIYIGRYPKIGWKLCEEYEACRDNAGRCTNCHSSGQCK